LTWNHGLSGDVIFGLGPTLTYECLIRVHERNRQTDKQDSMAIPRYADRVK